MKLVLDTLFYPFVSGALDGAGQRALFFNAQYHDAFSEFGDVFCIQYFKPYVNELIQYGSSVLDVVPDDKFAICLIAAPKNIIEARHMIAQALFAVRTGGVIVAAADNKAGGGRLMSLFQSFGLDVKSNSRNRCRVVWAVVETFDSVLAEDFLQAGAEQNVLELEGGYRSQPGVFGWNKLDVGSTVLVDYFPQFFKGIGADFGCGYGFLSREVMGRAQGVDALYVLDADVRSVNLCAKNVQGVRSVWSDIVGEEDLPAGLDFIVMNPPFHEGKMSNSGIGVSFIEKAACSLKKGGVLWIVANAHLPYEAVLERSFSVYERLGQSKGFKVFKAVR